MYLKSTLQANCKPNLFFLIMNSETTADEIPKNLVYCRIVIDHVLCRLRVSTQINYQKIDWNVKRLNSLGEGFQRQ